MEEYILKISTKDEKGLIYNISKVLFANNLNIDQNAEYVDEETNEFFMRSLISGKVMETILQKELKEVLPDGAKITLNKNISTKDKGKIVGYYSADDGINEFTGSLIMK